jgi:nucleotide-binding universal stress UspA family protein
MQLPIKNIMIPIDGSKNSIAALQVAIGLTKDYDVNLQIVHVLLITSSLSALDAAGSESLQAIYQSHIKDANKIINEDLDLTKKHEVKAQGHIVNSTSIVEAIVEKAASFNVDLIVLGTKGLRFQENAHRKCINRCINSCILLCPCSKIIFMT